MDNDSYATIKTRQFYGRSIGVTIYRLKTSRFNRYGDIVESERAHITDVLRRYLHRWAERHGHVAGSLFEVSGTRWPVPTIWATGHAIKDVPEEYRKNVAPYADSPYVTVMDHESRLPVLSWRP